MAEMLYFVLFMYFTLQSNRDNTVRTALICQLRTDLTIPLYNMKKSLF